MKKTSLFVLLILLTACTKRMTFDEYCESIGAPKGSRDYVQCRLHVETEHRRQVAAIADQAHRTAMMTNR